MKRKMLMGFFGAVFVFALGVTAFPPYCGAAAETAAEKAAAAKAAAAKLTAAAGAKVAAANNAKAAAVKDALAAAAARAVAKADDAAVAKATTAAAKKAAALKAAKADAAAAAAWAKAAQAYTAAAHLAMNASATETLAAAALRSAGNTARSNAYLTSAAAFVKRAGALADTAKAQAAAAKGAYADAQAKIAKNPAAEASVAAAGASANAAAKQAAEAINLVFNGSKLEVKNMPSNEAAAKIMIMANALAAMQLPYLWGGGHGSTPITKGLDCSGAVDQILTAAGFKVPAGAVAGWYTNFGNPVAHGQDLNKGAYVVTINPNVHVFLVVDGHVFQSSGSPNDAKGGPQWTGTFDLASMAGSNYTIRRVPGS